jgi:hypothetical protein
MHPPSLPVPPADLPARLSRALAPRRNGLELSVTAAELVEDGTEFGLQLAVSVTSGEQPDPQRWRVILPLGPPDPEDPLEDLNADSFVITCRANLEEWWDMKGQEPRIAAWGLSLS